MELSKEVLKGHIDTLIVSILNEKDCYGYEIAKQVREKSQTNTICFRKTGKMMSWLKNGKEFVKNT